MIDIQRQPDGLKITGEVDIATSDEFENAINELVKAELPLIRLDLEDMEYIDSTGLGILMNIKKNRLGENQDIILVNPKRSIAKLMQLTGVDRIFKIEN